MVRTAKPLTADHILLAAERIFTRQGYGETSLRQLIAESGVSATAFYARYVSKEAVLEALIGRVLSDFFASASTAFAKSRDVDEAFTAGAQVLRGAFGEHRALMRLMLTEAAASPTVRRTIHGAYAAIANMLAANLARVRPTDSPALLQTIAWSMIGSVQIHVMRWAVFDELDDATLATELEVTAQMLRAMAVRDQ